MKKLLLTLLLAAPLAYGQNKFGVFTGVNNSYFTTGFFKKADVQDGFGLQIGALYQMPLTQKIAFRPKLAFSQQGDRDKTSLDYGFYIPQIDYKLNYLNLAADFKFWNKIYLLAGPQVGYLISTKKESLDFGGPKTDFDIGVNLGGGFTVNNLFFELGVYEGFSTLFIIRYEDVMNGLFKFTVGYTF